MKKVAMKKVVSTLLKLSKGQMSHLVGVSISLCGQGLCFEASQVDQLLIASHGCLENKGQSHSVVTFTLNHTIHFPNIPHSAPGAFAWDIRNFFL